MLSNMELRRKVHELTEYVSGDVHHGECFYDKEMLDGFINNLDELKQTAIQYFESNKNEDDE